MLWLFFVTLVLSAGVHQKNNVEELLGMRNCLHPAHAKLIDAQYSALRDIDSVLALQGAGFEELARALRLGLGFCPALSAMRGTLRQRLGAKMRQREPPIPPAEQERRGWPQMMAQLRNETGACEALVLDKEDPRAATGLLSPVVSCVTRQRKSAMIKMIGGRMD
jgi:hypothetical protein